MSAPASGLACALFVAALAPGCGGSAARCTSSLACGRERVCGHDGVCAALAEPAASVLAPSVRLQARDWGVTRPDALSDVVGVDDALEIGGEHDSWAHLSFSPLPPGAVARAVLSLEPHEAAPRATEDLTLVVARTAAFRGERLTRRRAPGELDPKLERTIAAGTLAPLHLDVTELVRAAQRLASDRLDVVLRRLEGRGALVYASAHAADPRARPRLDLIMAQARAP